MTAITITRRQCSSLGLTNSIWKTRQTWPWATRSAETSRLPSARANQSSVSTHQYRTDAKPSHMVGNAGAQALGGNATRRCRTLSRRTTSQRLRRRARSPSTSGIRLNSRSHSCQEWPVRGEEMAIVCFTLVELPTSWPSARPRRSRRPLQAGQILTLIGSYQIRPRHPRRPRRRPLRHHRRRHGNRRRRQQRSATPDASTQWRAPSPSPTPHAASATSTDQATTIRSPATRRSTVKRQPKQVGTCSRARRACGCRRTRPARARAARSSAAG